MNWMFVNKVLKNAYKHSTNQQKFEVYDFERILPILNNVLNQSKIKKFEGLSENCFT